MALTTLPSTKKLCRIFDCIDSHSVKNYLKVKLMEADIMKMLTTEEYKNPHFDVMINEVRMELGTSSNGIHSLVKEFYENFTESEKEDADLCLALIKLEYSNTPQPVYISDPSAEGYIE